MLALICATVLQSPPNIQFLFTRLANDQVEVCRYAKGRTTVLLKETLRRHESPNLDQFSLAISRDGKRFLRVPLVSASVRSIKVYGVDGALQAATDIKDPKAEPWMFGFDDAGNVIGLRQEGEKHKQWQMSKGGAESSIAIDKLPKTFKDINAHIDPPAANTPFWTNGNSWHEPSPGASDGADTGKGVAKSVPFWFTLDGEFGIGNKRKKFALPKGYDYLFAMQYLSTNEYLGIIGAKAKDGLRGSRQNHQTKCALMRPETGEVEILCDAVVAVPLK